MLQVDLRLHIFIALPKRELCFSDLLRRSPVALEQPLDSSNDFSLGPAFQAYAAVSSEWSQLLGANDSQAAQLSRFVDSEAARRKLHLKFT